MSVRYILYILVLFSFIATGGCELACVLPRSVATSVHEQAVPGTPLSFHTVLVPPGTLDWAEEVSGKRVEVQMDGFYIGVHEVTWDLYDAFAYDKGVVGESVADADGVSRPSPEYVPLNLSMGRSGGFPAASMSQLAAKQFTKWLTVRTGTFHRLPTEAEWRYAMMRGDRVNRSDATSVNSIIDHGAWHLENSDEQYHRVGEKVADISGLFDMRGNVAEWVLDGYVDDPVSARIAAGDDAKRGTWFVTPTKKYPRATMGGSFMTSPGDMTGVRREPSSRSWNLTDPALPTSIWWLREGQLVGFRVVQPINPPPRDQWERYWEPDIEQDREIYQHQRVERGLDGGEGR